MNLQPFIQNRAFINTLSEEECFALCEPFKRKVIRDPALKETVEALRSRHQQLYRLNPERITSDHGIQLLFESYKTYPHLVDRLSVEELEEIINLLRGKVSIADHLKQLRASCQARLSFLTTIQNRRDRAQRDAPRLYDAITNLYNVTEDSWKRIDRMCSAKPHKVRKERKAIGRMLGLAINDLPIISTNLYSLNALRNICNSKSTDNKQASVTDEHFWSLYTHAGPAVVDEALGRRYHWNINHLIALVFKFNQTTKTTKHENSRLAKYHEHTDFIHPQLSYDAVGVSQLVYCPKSADSEIVMKYQEVFKLVDMNVAETEPTFTNTISLDEAISQHPELAEVRSLLKL